ncbi:MAG: GNAT family N-acetyltransferase [Gammaproteobacteria bacterium]
MIFLSNRTEKTDNSGHYRVRRADWAKDEAHIKAIRHEVFVVEQNVPESLEWDGLDAQCRHILVADGDHRPVATGRLDTRGKIGRMAVLSTHRQRGAGSLILNALLVWAQEAGLTECYLHAQTHALAFYHRHGFMEEGFVFYEAGIPHLTMRRPAANPILALLDSRQERFQGFLRLLRMSRREISIDAPIPDFGAGPVDALFTEIKRLAQQNREPAIRILTQPEAVRDRSFAPLLALARRLPSHIGIRCPAPEDQLSRDHWIIGDHRHWIHVPDPDRLTGQLALESPELALPAVHRFHARWDRALADPEFYDWSL